MLETALLSSRSPARAHAVRLSLPAIVALHGAVLAGFVAASVWNPGDPVEPAIPIVFGRFASPPPPPGGGNEVRTVRPQTGPKAAVALPTKIERIPDALATQHTLAAQALPVDDASGEGGGSGGGPPRGVPGGTGDGSEAPVEGDDLDLPRPGGDISYPVLVHRVEPEYPRPAVATRSEGVVILDAIITAAGSVDEVRVLRSANPLLDEAAVRAVQKWTYRPALLNGRPVRVRLTVTVKFSMPAV
jgi:TonB family protein